jgi:hypothetical protein
VRFDFPGMQFFDDSGEVLTNGSITFLDVLTGLPKATYYDEEQQIQNTHPVELDAAGRPPPIFLSGTYKAEVRDYLGALVFTGQPFGNTDAVSLSVTTVTPTRNGEGFTAPDARLLSTGTGIYSIFNNSPYYYLFKDSLGDIQFFIPAYTNSIVTLADNSTQAGVWSGSDSAPLGIAAEFNMEVATAITANYRVKVVAIDDDRDCIIVFGTGAAHTMAYNKATGTKGNVLQIKTLPAGTHLCQAIKSGTDQVLIQFQENGGTTIDGRVITYADVTATLGATTPKTMSGVVANIGSANPDDGRGIIQADAFFITPYVLAGGTPGVLACSIAANVVTFGNEVSLTGASQCPFLFYQSTGVVLAISLTAATNLHFRPVVVAITPTLGTVADVSTAATTLNGVLMDWISTSRVAVFHNVGGTPVLEIASCSATTVTRTQTTTGAGGTFGNPMMLVVGSQAIVASTTGANAGTANVISDSGGVGSAGVALTFSYSNLFECAGFSDTELSIAATDGSGKYRLWTVGITGANPTLVDSSTAAGINGVTFDSLSTHTMGGTRKIYGSASSVKFGIGNKHRGNTVSAGSSARYINYNGRAVQKMDAVSENSEAYWQLYDEYEATWCMSSMTQGGTIWNIKQVVIT